MFVYSPSLVFVCLSVCPSVCVSISLSTFVLASLKKKLSFLTTSYTEKYQPVVKDF